MEISSWECLPNLGGEQRSDPALSSWPLPASPRASPPGIVQVQQEAIVPKVGEHLVVVPVHVPCRREFSQLSQAFLQVCMECWFATLEVPRVMLG